MKTNFEKFVTGYLECAAWADAPEGSQARYPRKSILAAEADCRRFIEAAGLLIEQAAEFRDWEYLGHDFWLSRCGHGTGFWDRPELTSQLPCAAVYGRHRWEAGCFSLDSSDLGRALSDIAYGNSKAISEFAYAEIYAHRGWLYFT